MRAQLCAGLFPVLLLLLAVLLLLPSFGHAILQVAASRTLFPLVPAVADASAFIPALSPSACDGHSLDSVVLSEPWLCTYLPLLTVPASPPSERRHLLTSSARTPNQHLLRHRHGSRDHGRNCSRNCNGSRLGTQSNQVYPTVEGHHHLELSAPVNNPKTPSDDSPLPDCSQDTLTALISSSLGTDNSRVFAMTPPPIAEAPWAPIKLSLAPDYSQDTVWAPILAVSAATPTPGADGASVPILVVPGPMPAEAPRTLSTPSPAPPTLNSVPAPGSEASWTVVIILSPAPANSQVPDPSSPTPMVEAPSIPITFSPAPVSVPASIASSPAQAVPASAPTPLIEAPGVTPTPPDPAPGSSQAETVPTSAPRAGAPGTSIAPSLAPGLLAPTTSPSPGAPISPSPAPMPVSTYAPAADSPSGLAPTPIAGSPAPNNYQDVPAPTPRPVADSASTPAATPMADSPTPEISEAVPAPTPASRANSPASLAPAPIAEPPAVTTSSAPVPSANSPLSPASSVPAPSQGISSAPASATPTASASAPPDIAPSTPAASPSSATPAASADPPSGTAPLTPASSPSDSGSSAPAPSGDTPSAPASSTPAASADPPSSPSAPAASPPSDSGSSVPAPSEDTPSAPASRTPTTSADPPSSTPPSTPAADPPSGSGASVPAPSGDTPLAPASATPTGSADPPSSTSPSTPAVDPPSGSGSSVPAPSGDTPSAPASTTPPTSSDGSPSGTAPSTPAVGPPSGSGSSVPASSGGAPSAPTSATPAAGADPPSSTTFSMPADSPPSGSGSSVPAPSGDTPSAPASTTPAVSADPPSGTAPSTPAVGPPSDSGSSVPAPSGNTPSAPASTTPAVSADPPSGTSPSTPAAIPPSGSGSSVPAPSGDTPPTPTSALPAASADPPSRTPSSIPVGGAGPASTPITGSLSPAAAPTPASFASGPAAPVPAPVPAYALMTPSSDSPQPDSCQDCACEDGYTNTPPGLPWRCVLPMQATLQLEISIDTLFPLVPELARELANQLFLLQSQVRIVGANAVDPDLDQTDVNADFVPLHQVFDNSTAVLLASRLWTHQVMLDRLLFGPSYKVVRVQYPGLPPLPGSKAPHASSSQTNRGTPQGLGTKKGNHKKIGVIAVASAIGVVISFGVIWFMCLRHCSLWEGSVAVIEPVSVSTSRQSEHPAGDSKLPGMSTSMFESGMPAYTSSTRQFSLAELERATEKFKIDNIVGEGGFGRVYRGVLDNGVCVAIKVLTCVHQQGNYEFIAEVEMLSRLHHRNLVTLIGICTENCMCFLVYEFIPNGSVESHLHGADRLIAPLEWKERVKIALGAARGLAYLHEDSNPKVIHRDFKASNILLEDDFTPKVSDFGLAKEAADGGISQHISTRVMGTFGYVAPEYAMTGQLLVKSDVYSYGVVLLELLSGRKPVDISQLHGQENLVTWARPLLCSREGLEMLVDPDLHNNFHFDDYRRMAAIASMCVQPEVSHRPSMGEVVQALLPLLKDSTAFSDSSPQEEFSAPARTGISVTISSQPNSQILSSSSIASSDYNSEPLHHHSGRPLSASAVSTGSGRRIRQLLGSFHRHSTLFMSQTPLRNKPPPWYRDRGTKAVTKSDHGTTRDKGKQTQRGLSNHYWA